MDVESGVGENEHDLWVCAGQYGRSDPLIPITLVADHPWLLPLPSAQAWGAWIGIALLSTALAYLI